MTVSAVPRTLARLSGAEQPQRVHVDAKTAGLVWAGRRTRGVRAAVGLARELPASAPV